MGPEKEAQGRIEEIKVEQRQAFLLILLGYLKLQLALIR